MKRKSKHKLLMTTITFLSTLMLSATAFAAETTGELKIVDDSHISGWAWNVGSYDETVNVELHIYKDGASETAKVITVLADSFDPEVSKSIGDGYHAFDYEVNWSELGGASYKVEAYAIAGEEKILLPDSKEYKAGSKPEVQEKAEQPQESVSEKAEYKKGKSLGIFTTTGYCNCNRCSGGSGLTYSGTVPQPNHTLSADLNVLPLGTKVMIDDVVYTVEDMGSGVDGHKVDLYYGSHGSALAHGLKNQEVFQVIKE